VVNGKVLMPFQPYRTAVVFGIGSILSTLMLIICIECLKDLISNRKKPIYVITDGHPVHKSKKVKEFVASLKGRLSIFILLPYAPDLNPDELVWNYIRQTGTARSPLKKGESLWERTFIDLELIAQDKALVKSSFRNETVSFAAGWVVYSL
jgi:transposase